MFKPFSQSSPPEASRGWEHVIEMKSYWFILLWVTHFLLSSTKISRSFTQTTFKEKHHLQTIFFVSWYRDLLDDLSWCTYSLLFPLLFVKTFEVMSAQQFHVILRHTLGDIHTLVVVSYPSKSLQQLITSTRPQLCECGIPQCWQWAEEKLIHWKLWNFEVLI